MPTLLRSGLAGNRHSVLPERRLLAAIFPGEVKIRQIEALNLPADMPKYAKGSCTSCGADLPVCNLRKISLDSNIKGAEKVLCLPCIKRMMTAKLTVLADANGLALSHVRFIANLYRNTWNAVMVSKGRKIHGVDFEHVIRLWTSQKGKCAVTGRQMVLKHDKAGGGLNASIDRIDNDKGYVSGNIQFVCWAVNEMKGRRSTAVLMDWCRAILDGAQK